jgi:hypothetical protein
MLKMRPVRPADTRALLVSVLRKLDRLTLDAYTPAWIRPNTER